ncbi:hypothetical protein RFN58_04525 [Streptomyces iakyrus]|uniref:hypothetical protein n=1 Tax=Streptomyces iakyrus TaxID=68219 RepID=UPI000524BA16|nr:hypothetical protein [Streptomyces iakyrus]
MTSISDHVNGRSPMLFGDLRTTHGARHLSELTPVMATPAAFAAGVGVSVAAYAVGYAVGALGSKQPS